LAALLAKSAASETGKAVGANVEKLHPKIGLRMLEQDFLVKTVFDECRTGAVSQHTGWTN
jgi:hypothetical protein